MIVLRQAVFFLYIKKIIYLPISHMKVINIGIIHFLNIVVVTSCCV